MAARIGYGQAFISGLELDKKGLPNEEFLKKLISGLGLNEQEVHKLYKAVEEFRRRFILPQNTTMNEYKLVNELWWHIGNLLPAQIVMIREVLNLPEQLIPAISLERKQGENVKTGHPARMPHSAISHKTARGSLILFVGLFTPECW